MVSHQWRRFAFFSKEVVKDDNGEKWAGLQVCRLFVCLFVCLFVSLFVCSIEFSFAFMFVYVLVFALLNGLIAFKNDLVLVSV